MPPRNEPWPRDPEQYRYHWLQPPWGRKPCVGEWDAETETWSGATNPLTPPSAMDGWLYLGPCLTPKQHKALLERITRLERQVVGG